MLPAALPLDYLRHLDRGDRIRRPSHRPSETRVRRDFVTAGTTDRFVSRPRRERP